MLKRAAALAIVLLLAACSTSSYLKTMATSGDMLLLLRDTYLSAGATFDQLCPTQVISAGDCAAWAGFAERFGPAYVRAATAWRAAADADSAGDALVQVLALQADLAYYVLVAAEAKGGP